MWVLFGSSVIRLLLSFLLLIAVFGVFASPTPVFAAGLTISSRTPAANALDVAKTSNIEVQFNTSINGTTVNENTFNVDGSISGKVAGSYSGGGSSNITFDAIDLVKVPSSKKMKATVDPEKCWGCGICVVGCPPSAILFSRVRDDDLFTELFPKLDMTRGFEISDSHEH